MFRHWWESAKPMTVPYAWFNVGVGAACIVLALLGIDLGLGDTFGLWMLGLVFGVVPLAWGAVALPLGRDGRVARPLRLAGDVLLWGGMVVFTLLGLFVADPRETGPLVTLLVFVAIASAGAVLNRRNASGGDRAAVRSS